VTGTSSARVRRWRRTLKSDGRRPDGRLSGNCSWDAQGRSAKRTWQPTTATERCCRLGRAFLRLYRWDPPTLSIVAIRRWRRSLTGTSRLSVGNGRKSGLARARGHVRGRSTDSDLRMLRSAYRESTLVSPGTAVPGIDAVLAEDRPAVRPSDVQRPVSRCRLGVRSSRTTASWWGQRRCAADAFLQHGSILLDGIQPSSGNGKRPSGGPGRPVSFQEVPDVIINTWMTQTVRPTGRPAVRHCVSRRAVKC